VSALLSRALEADSLRVVFQPVIDLRHGGGVAYLEALVRGPRGSTLENPATLFAYARKHRAEWAMDRTALQAILREARALPKSLALGLNVHISTVADAPGFLAFLCDLARESGVDPERIVLELVEEGSSWHAKRLGESGGTA
jgi:EAL domain-containing protein (putative c-di-GMP-specific phosphodiesterase class I)